MRRNVRSWLICRLELVMWERDRLHCPESLSKFAIFQEIARILNRTRGAELFFLQITGATQTVKQVGQNLTRLFGSEIQEMKKTNQRLEEQNVSLHAKFIEFEIKLDRMLEILEDFNQQATPGEPTGSPSQEHMLTIQWDSRYPRRDCRCRTIPPIFLR